MKKNYTPESLVLRQKAEERLKSKLSKVGTKLSEKEAIKLLHELEVHRVELEMQNEELIQAREQLIIDSEKKYMELYDLAPSGYFTLSPKGEIIQFNLAGAAMLGKTRSQLKNQLFQVFVSDNSKPIFLHFLEKVFRSHEKEICELMLSTNGDRPMYILITGIIPENGCNCFLTMIDITERKLLESSLVEKMILLRETEKAGKIGGWSFNVKTLTQTWTKETFKILEIETSMGEPKVPEGIEFIDEPYKETAKLAIQRAIEFGEPFEQQWKVTTAKGNKRWVNSIGKAKIVKGKTVSLSGSFHDITERMEAEEDLREINEFNRLLLSTMPLGMDIVDEEGNILYMSEGLKLHAGANAFTKKCWEIYRDDNTQCKDCPLRSGIKNGETRTYEAQKVFGGKIFEVSHTGMIYKGKKALLKIFMDITDKKQAEALLIESEKKYHAIFDNIQDVFYQTNLDGTVLEISPSIKHFSDFNREEIIGKSVTNLYYDPNDRHKLIGLLMENGQFSDYELRLKTKPGELRYVSNNARLIFDADGSPNHIEGAVRDITGRKLAEIELRESKEFLNNIINAVASPVFVKDNEHKYVLVNNAFSALFNLPFEKIIGTTGYEYFPKDQMKVIVAKDTEVFKTGTVNVNEEFLTDGTGDARTLVTRKTLYTDTAGNKFLVGVINDITERKLAEIQIRKLYRVYEVLSNINKTIVRIRDRQFLFDEACRIAVEKGEFIMSFIGMVNSTTNKIDIVASSGKTGEYLNNINIDLSNKVRSSGPIGLAIKSGEFSFSNNIQSDDNMIPWRKNAVKYGYRSLIALPIIVSGKTVGIYALYSGELGFFNEEEIELLKELATDISFALEFIESEKERRQAAEALKENNVRLELAMQSAKMAWWEMDVATGKVIFDKRKSEMMGYPAKKFKHYTDFVALVHPEDAEKVMEAFQKLMDGLVDKYETEYRILTKSGEYKWFYDIGAVVKKDTNGMPLFVNGLVIDITSRKQSELALRASELKYHNIFNNVQDVFYQTDLEGTVIDVSPSVKNFSEFNRDEIVGKPVTNLYYNPSDRDLFLDLLKEKGEVRDYELRLKSKTGEIKFTSIYARLIFDSNGKPNHIDGALRDITERKLTEDALRKSEAIQSKIVSNIGDVIVIIDQNGINRYKSPNIETLFGWKAEDLVGKSTWDLVHPDDIDSSQKIVAQIALSPNATETIEIRYRRKDGVYVWIEITLVNLLADPDIQGVLGNYHDITERRQAQEKIREKDQEFKKLSSNLPDLIFQFTRSSDGTYSVPIASDGIKNIFGCTPEDVFDDFTLICRVIHPDDIERVIADIEYSAKHLTFLTCEFRVLLPGKPIQWIYSKSTPEKMPDGSVTWYGFNANLTDRKRAEESLVKLKTAIEKSQISVVITDSKGNIEYANPFFSELSGYSPDEYLGQNPRILKSAYHPKEFYEDFWNTITSGQTWEGEFYNCKKNGEMYWEHVIVSPIENNNMEITHFVAVKTDITNVKNINFELVSAKERAEESDRLKSAFLANMSHEIRTPMNGILGFAEMLKEPDLSEELQNYYISIIEKSGARLLNIINDIIDISKIESGQMKVKFSEINTNEYLEIIQAFFQPEADIKNIKLTSIAGLPLEKAFIRTDSDKLYAILVNLVKNALKYTEKGFIEFGYVLKLVTNNGTLVPTMEFYVKDTGIGIPYNRQEAIFERFIQADILDKMARQGAGLGLSISKAYVEMLGGRIWVESIEEDLSTGTAGGSTFYFSLPLKAKPNPGTERNVSDEMLSQGNNIHINGLKILIAEDDESSRKLASIALMKFGKEIIETQTGTEAVEACRNNPNIDLVLMDIQMPEMNGYEAARQIRQFNTKVIIIAVTAFALTGDREKAIEAGCTDYISKPIKAGDLMEKINQYF